MIFISGCNLFDAKKPEKEDASSDSPVNSAEEYLSNSVSDEQATFPGGTQEMMQYLSKNIHYPENCSANEIQGKVYIEFVIAKDGSVTNAKIKRSVHPDLDNEALRVVKSMPRWNPAHTKDGNTVQQRYSLPINFKIQ